MAMDDQGAQAHLTALAGVFDSQKEQLELQDDIYVRTDNNQEVWLKSAKADFKAGTVSSKEAVRVKLPTTTIEADALDITDNGRVISFVGRVRTVIESAAAPAAQKAPPAPEAPARTSQAEPVSLRQ
jgi:lipopolysaccharide export system protein LptC